MAWGRRNTILAAAAAAVLLALAGGGIYVSRPAFHARMLAGVDAKLSAVLGRQFTVGSVRYRFPLSLVIRDVAVASRDSVVRGTLALLPEIRVVASPWRSLFNGRFTVSSVVLRNARISLEQYRDGAWNFAGLLKTDSTKPKKKGPASFPPLALSDIRIENLTVDLRTPRASETIEQVNLGLGLRMGGPHLAADIRDLRAVDRTRGASIDGLRGRLALDGDTIRADQLQLRSGGSSLFLTGWMESKHRALAVSSCRAVLELQDLAALTRTPRSAWAGTVRLDATASGSSDAPQARATVSAKACTFNGVRIDGIEARVAVAGSVASLENLLLRAGPGEIAASATLDYRSNAYSGSAALSRLDLGRMLPPARKVLATDLNATLAFSGRGYNLAAMAGQLRLTMSRSSVNSVPISRLEARITAGDGEAAIEQLTLQSGQASLGITGDVYKDAVSIELETDEIELAQFGPLVGLNNLNGKLHFTGLISGPLKNPDVIGTFRLKEVMVGDFACHYFDGSMSIKSVTTRPLGDGKFTAQEIYFGKQTVNRIDILTELRGTEWGGVSIVVDKDSITSAKIDARAEINGKNINVVVSKLFYSVGDQYVANSQPIRVGIAGPAITLQPTELLVARGRLKLEGQYRADRTFRAKLSGRDIDSRRLVALAGLDRTVHGTIDFDAEASGPLADPVLSLSLDVANPRYEQFAYDELSLDAGYSEKMLHLRKLAIYHYGQVSEITADVGIDLGVGPGMGKLQDKPMSAEVVLRDIGTGLFFPLADLLSVMEGRVDVNVKAAGTPFKPLLSGNLTINQAKMVLRPLGMYLHNVQAMAHFNADSVVVDNITGVTEGSGTVQLGGHLLLKQFLPTTMRFDVSTTRSPIRNIPFIEANVNSQITIGGSMDYIRIGGNAQVNSALITLPFAPAEEPPPPEGAQKPMDLDLAITGGNNIWLRNKDADIELKIDNLNVRMSQNVLFLSGRLEPLRGVYRFLDRSFDITGGDLTFTNAAVINPVLNLSAHTTVTTGDTTRDRSTLDVYLQVSGTALQPKLSFRSVPARSEQDILSLLGAGMKIDESGTDFNLTNQALRGVDYALGIAAGKIQRGTGLDMLKIKTVSGSDKGAQVTLGKYLSRNIFVSYSQGFSANLSNEFKAEYLFGSRSAMFAQKDDKGKYNLGVRMKFKY